MAKNRIEIDSIDKDGKPKTVFVKMPDSQDNKEAQLAYNKAFREALQSGAVLRQKLEKIMEEQGINPSRLLTASVGLSGEVGEFNDIVKKIIFQGKEIFRSAP